MFQYHGAEHKAIAAYENDVELTAESAQQFSTEHVRCGTNFLLTVMVVTIVVYSFVGRPGWALLILSRIVLIPLIAGISYEVIRFAARHMDWRGCGCLMKPGLLLQRLTTRQPTLDQVEVAVASLRAVLTAEQLAEVEARPRASRRARACSPRSGQREVRDLLRAPAAAPVGGRLRIHADPARARAVRARRPARHRLRVGGRAPLPRGVQPLQRARGVPRRRLAAHEAHPARPRHRADAAAVQPSRRGSPSASRCSTSSPAGASTSAPASRRRRRSSAGSASTPSSKRAMWEEGLRVALRCLTETPVHRSRRRVRHHAAPQRRAQAGAEAAPAGVGGVQPPRHDPPRRAEGDRCARVRVHRSRRGAALDDRLLRHARERVRADRRRRQPERRVRHHVHVPRRRGRGAAARARGRELLRLLARALLRVRPSPSRGRPTCGRSTARSAATAATSPKRWRPRRATATASARRSCRRAGSSVSAGAIGTPDQIRDYLRRYEECGVDQVIFCSQAGKNRHEHIMESLELFGTKVLPEFMERDEQQQREKAKRLAPVIDAALARKPADDHPPLPDRRLRVPGHPARAGRPRRRRRLPPVARRLRREDRPRRRRRVQRSHRLTRRRGFTRS